MCVYIYIYIYTCTFSYTYVTYTRCPAALPPTAMPSVQVAPAYRHVLAPYQRWALTAPPCALADFADPTPCTPPG